MKKNLLKLSGLSVGFGASFVPFLALAQAGQAATSCVGIQNASNLVEFMCKIQQFLNATIPFAVALGVIYLIWGVIMYVVADEEEAKKKGRDKVIYGIIGLAIVFSIWGIIRMVTNSFGIDDQAGRDILYPCLPGADC